MYSCNKDEEPELTTYNLEKATVKGKVFADLDITNSTYENAPSGTTVTARVRYSDLGISVGSGIMNQYKLYTTTVNSSGDYTLSIDASTSGTSAYFYLDDFTYDQILSSDSLGIVKVRKIYYTDDFSLEVFSGRTTINDVYLQDTY